MPKKRREITLQCADRRLSPGTVQRAIDQLEISIMNPAKLYINQMLGIQAWCSVDGCDAREVIEIIVQDNEQMPPGEEPMMGGACVYFPWYIVTAEAILKSDGRYELTVEQLYAGHSIDLLKHITECAILLSVIRQWPISNDTDIYHACCEDFDIGVPLGHEDVEIKMVEVETPGGLKFKMGYSQELDILGIGVPPPPHPEEDS